MTSFMHGRSAVYDMVLRRSLLSVMGRRTEGLRAPVSGFFMHHKDETKDEYRKGHFLGALVDARYTCHTWWAEAMTAVAVETVKDFTHSKDDKAQERDCCCSDNCHTDTQFRLDDILFSLGRDYDFEDGQSISFYGLVGVPTQSPDAFKAPLVGTGFYTLGAGFDGEYRFYEEQDYAISLIASGRLFHSFKRRLHVTFKEKNGKTSLVPAEDFNRQGVVKFDMGNRFDALVGVEYSLLDHRFELGYAPSVPFGQRIRIKNFKESICEWKKHESPETACRHKVYGQYRVLLPLIDDCPIALGVGVSYGFHSSDEKDHHKGHDITGWISASVQF